MVFKPMWLLFLIFLLAVAEYGDIKFRLAHCGLSEKKKGGGDIFEETESEINPFKE